MKTEDTLDKMANIAKEEQDKHEFSIAHNHIFLMSKKLYKQIVDFYGLDMEDVRVLKFRDYTILKFDGVTSEFILFGEIHSIV